jgi:hypothetical protein
MNLEQYAARQKMKETLITVAIVTVMTLAPLVMFIALLLHGAAIAGK